MVKFIVNLVIVLLLIAGCSNDDFLENQTLFGNWRQTASFNGGPQGNELMQIQNGRTLNFDVDGTVTSNSRDCNGTFNYDDNTIEVDFPCFGFTTYDYEFIDGKMKLTEQDSSCDEGCYSIYTKNE